MRSPLIDPQENMIAEFLQEFIGDDGLDASRALVIWHGPRLPMTKAIDIETAVRACENPPPPGNAYFAVCRIDVRGLSESQRGSSERVTQVPGVWLDIDFEYDDAHAKGGLPPTLKHALRVIELMPVKPTAVVHSGHGLHAYWLFNEPEDTTTGEARDHMELLSFRWNQHAREVCERLGWQIDSTFDLARVLRVPGTTNHKHEPIECVLLPELTDWRRRYEPSDLEEFVLKIPDTRRRAIAARVVSDDLPSKIEITRAEHREVWGPMVEALRESVPGFAALWDRKPKRGEEVAGASEWDMKFACSMVAHLRNSGTLTHWPDERLLKLMSLYREEHPNDAKPQKAFDTRYLAYTLEKAKLLVFESDEAERKHIEAEAQAIERERDMAVSAKVVEKAEAEVRNAIGRGEHEEAKRIQAGAHDQVMAAQRRTIDIVLDSLLATRDGGVDLVRVEIVRTVGAFADALVLEWKSGDATEVISHPVGNIDSQRARLCRTMKTRGIPLREDYISPPRPWNPALMKWPDVVTALCSVAVSPPLGEVGGPDEEDRVVEQMLVDYFRITVGGSRLEANLAANTEGLSVAGDVSALIGGAGAEETERRATLLNAFRHGLPAYHYQHGPPCSGKQLGLTISLAQATQIMQDQMDREDHTARFPSATMRSKAIRAWMVRHSFLADARESLRDYSASLAEGTKLVRKKRLLLPIQAIDKLLSRDDSSDLSGVLLSGDR